MAVHWVAVMQVLSVQHLDDAADLGTPRTAAIGYSSEHVNNVQDCCLWSALTQGMTEGFKLGVVVRDDLATWQKLNVAAFVTSGIGSRYRALVGNDYIDASGVSYLPKLVLPCRVFVADGAAMRRAFDRALGRSLTLSVYTDDLFATMNDDENRAAVAAVATSDLSVAGFAAVGEAKQIDKALDRLRPHP
jgi:hypothetical protein